MKIFVNGCFDVLHIGHKRLFEFAKSKGSELVVAIDSDDRVLQSKGTGRPINTQNDRLELLESIVYIDRVIIFNTNEELEGIIKLERPDIMIVGSDWKGRDIVGGSFAKKILFFERIANYSTTSIIKSSINR